MSAMNDNTSDSPILRVENLNVSFHTSKGVVRAVHRVGFDLAREKLGIVGESGSGKSTVGRAILGLIRPPGRVEADTIRFHEQDLRALSTRQWRGIRGKRIGMVMQDPKYSLNPVMRIGEQISETLRVRERLTRAERKRRVLAALEAVRIRDSERVYRAYPHELSGGMGQRAMIAMMLVADPELLIADEPTSALDVTVQMQVLAVIDDLVSQRGMGLIFISHDLNLVASFCDRILVMYAGRVVESCRADALHQARHPYTRGLLESLPDVDNPRPVLPTLTRDPAWLEEDAP